MRNRMLLSYLLVAIVSLVVAYLAAILFLQFTLVNYVREHQIEASKSFQVFFEQYYQTNGNWDGIQQVNIQNLMDEAIPEENSQFGLTLVGTDGTILLTENKTKLGSIIAGSSLNFGAPVIVAGDTVAYLFVSRITDLLLPQLDGEAIIRAHVATIWATLVGLLVAILMSLLVTRTLLRPIGITIEAVKRISKGELGVRVPVEPYRDVAELGKAINDMAVDLEKNQRVQQLMLMDITHDLRTPLSVQKATIEAFEDKIYEFNEEGLAVLKSQNSQLIHLVEDLRLLTLSDAGNFVVRKERVELTVFIKDISNSFEGIFSKKDLHIVFQPGNDEYWVAIDPHLMRRVFENLLQNAFQHSPDGSEIHIKILRMINRMEIVVSDQGPGIPENKMDTIFDRYYRVKSSGGGVPEGLGLGLTISRYIVEAHEGKLYAKNSLAGGAEFIIELPYAN